MSVVLERRATHRRAVRFQGEFAFGTIIAPIVVTDISMFGSGIETTEYRQTPVGQSGLLVIIGVPSRTMGLMLPVLVANVRHNWGTRFTIGLRFRSLSRTQLADLQDLVAEAEER